MVLDCWTHLGAFVCCLLLQHGSGRNAIALGKIEYWVDMGRTIVLESFWPSFSHMTKVSMCISIVRGLFGHCSPETEREIDTDASDAEVFNLCCHLLTCEMSVRPWYSMSLYHPYIIMKKTYISGRRRRLWQPHGQGLKLRKARGKKRCSAETEVVKSKSEIRQKSLHKPRTFFRGLIWRFFVILYSTTESLNRRLLRTQARSSWDPALRKGRGQPGTSEDTNLKLRQSVRNQ